MTAPVPRGTRRRPGRQRAAGTWLDGSGHLDITAIDSGGSWTSGRIQTTTPNVGAPAGGELEVTAGIQQPDDGPGYWPAFWMLGPGQWPENGEIDIMEDVSESQVGAATWQAAFDHNMSIILDLAMGGGYPRDAATRALGSQHGTRSARSA